VCSKKKEWGGNSESRNDEGGGGVSGESREAKGFGRGGRVQRRNGLANRKRKGLGAWRKPGEGTFCVTKKKN